MSMKQTICEFVHGMTCEEVCQFVGGIVMCGDCSFSYEDELGNLRCRGPLTAPWDYYYDEPSDGVKVKPDGFCAWGERRKVK